MELSSPMCAGRHAAKIDFKSDLNSEQFAAVTGPGGPALVLAGAGSGKTRTLTYRVAWLRSQGVPPWRMLLLTFTNKAAREMLGRVEELIAEPIQMTWGGTFHSVGARFLRMHGAAINLDPHYTILDESDSESLVAEVIKHRDSAFLKHKDNPKARAIRDVISYARNTREALGSVILEQLPWAEKLADQIVGFADDYQKLKRDRQVADYDDLLELWYDALRADQSVLRHYREQFLHILVDEYQDTNLLQSEIIDLLADKHQVMAVGDDAQCIYTWRGARFENIANFPQRHPGTTIYRIETNYRSTPQILTLANGVLANRPAGVGFHKELRPVRPANQKPRVIGIIDTRQQAQFIINRVRSLVSEGFSLRDIAVLYRSHHQAVDAQIEFSRQGIPFVITSGVRFFEQAHIRDIAAQLRFLANQRDRSAFYRFAMLLSKVGERTAQRLYALVEKLAAEMNAAAEPDLFNPGSTPSSRLLCKALAHDEVLAKVPGDAKEDWDAMAATLIQAEEAMRAPTATSESDADPSRPENVVRILVEGWYGDFLKTGSGLSNWEMRREDLDTLIAFSRRFDNLTELLTQLVLLSSESGNRRAEPEEDCVRLTTVHQAKGLEFPVVFVIGLADGFFPLKRAIDAGDVDEERRLFYVAVTRAMDELYLCYPKVYQGKGGFMSLEPSRFLADISHEHYEHVFYDYGSF